MRLQGLAGAGVLFVALVLAPGVARADDTTSDLAADAAEALGEQAYRAFIAGKFADAIDLYTRAFDTAPAARFLLDIADIYEEKLADHARAVSFYRRYLEAPDAEPDLARHAAERVAAPAPATRASPTSTTPSPTFEPPPTAPPAGTPPMRTWGFVAGGAGMGAFALGAVLGLVARSKNDDAGRSCTGQACTDPRALQLTDQAAGLARAADIAFVAGGVLVVGGLSLVVLSPGPTRGIAVSGVFR